MRSSINRQFIDTHYGDFFMQQPHRIRPPVALGLLGLSAALWLAGCASPPVTENVPPPRISDLAPLTGHAPESLRNWQGTYQAVLPCNGCPGIAISVQLRDPHTAVVRERRLGSEADPAVPSQAYAGPFHFDPPGGPLITLGQGEEAPAYRFWVTEGWMEMRERATGAPLPQSALFRLRKTSQPAPWQSAGDGLAAPSAASTHEPSNK